MPSPRAVSPATLALGVVVLALLGCKKSDSTESTTEPALTASAGVPLEPARPAPTPSPEPTTPPATAEAPATAVAPATTEAPAPVPAPPAATSAVAKPIAPSLTPCCTALAAAAKKGGAHAARYQSAATVCQGLATAVKKGLAAYAGARTTLRAQLQSVPIPAGC